MGKNHASQYANFGSLLINPKKKSYPENKLIYHFAQYY